MNYLDKTVAEMRTSILKVLASYMDEDVRDIEEDAARDVDKILRENLLTSFKNGLEASKKPRSISARRK